MSEIAIKTEKTDDCASFNEEGLGVAAEPSPSPSNSFVTRRPEAAASSVPAMRAAMRAAATQAAAAAHRNQGPAAAAQHVQLKQQLQRKLKRAAPMQRPLPPLPPPPKPFLPGARCGEIFVANNARQWTFICTFCNKSTRDIGDFICHIKMKHLQESDGYYDDDAAGDHNAELEDFGGPQLQQQQAEEQDYLDCSSYLDVNVHTEEPDELSYNGVSLQQHQHQHQQALARKRHTADAAISSSANKVAKKSTAKSANPRDSFVVELLDDDDENNDGEQDEGALAPPEDYDENDIEQNITTHTSQRRAGPGPKSEQQKYVNANGGRKLKPEAAAAAEPMDYDDFDYSDEQYPHAADELRRHNQSSAHFGEGDDDDEDDDFDNQLLIAPGADDSSLEASALSVSLGSGVGGGTEGKRRQIRGTAYCALCNKTFQYYSLYRNHMIKHSNDTPYKCALCKKGFKSKQAIRYHMHTHQKEKKYQCQLCHHGYYTENQFITHVLTHENSSLFPCMVCGQILRSDKERDHHLATHTEERPFRCEFCNKLFRLRHHLSNHLKMHRQYRCDWCREEFTSAVHLRKPYACPVCDQLPEVRSNQTQKHRASASNSLDADPTGGAAGDLVNPLHLFETVEPPTECVDLAEMVSDSDADEEPQHDEDDEEEQEDDEEEEDLTAEPENHSSSYLLQRQQQQLMQQQRAGGAQPERQRLTCKYCQRSYSHLSGLNYHIRMKHR